MFAKIENDYINLNNLKIEELNKYNNYNFLFKNCEIIKINKEEEE